LGGELARPTFGKLQSPVEGQNRPCMRSMADPKNGIDKNAE
jgi:hypothetical protein